MVQVRIDVHHLDTEFLGPGPALRAFEAIGCIGVTRPEDHQLGVLQAILHRAIGLSCAKPHAVTPVMLCTPEPALPAIRRVHQLGHTDKVPEAVESTQIVTEVAPLVVRTVRHGDSTGTHFLAALDLARHDVDRFFPTDLNKFRLAAILDIALTVRIEVHSFQRFKNAVFRIHHRLLTERMRGRRRLARWRKFFAACLDGVGTRIAGVEIHRRRANDLAVFDVNENRPAVGAVRVTGNAVAHVGAAGPCIGLHARDEMHEPDDIRIRSVHRDLEILRGVDTVELIEWRRQKISSDFPVLEENRKSRLGMDTRAGRNPAVP